MSLFCTCYLLVFEPPLTMKMIAYCLDLKERVVRLAGVYLPSVGGISLVSLSTTVMEKQFLRNSLGEVQVVVKDVLWWYSHVGVGAWIYQRKHLDSASTLSRSVYCHCSVAVVLHHASVTL